MPTESYTKWFQAAIASSLAPSLTTRSVMSRASAPELRHGRASQKSVRASALSVSASGVGGGSASGGGSGAGVGGSRGSVSGGGGGSVTADARAAANERRGLDLQETHSAIKELGAPAHERQLARQREQQRGLAGADRPDQQHERAGRRRQVQLAHPHRPAGAAKGAGGERELARGRGRRRIDGSAGGRGRAGGGGGAADDGRLE